MDKSFILTMRATNGVMARHSLVAAGDAAGFDQIANLHTSAKCEHRAPPVICMVLVIMQMSRR